VGCLAWTVWSVSRWLAPDADCADRWGLRSTPRDLRRWGLRAGVAAAVAAGTGLTLWLVADSKYHRFVRECSDPHRCSPALAQSHRSTVGALDAAWITSAAIAAGLAATSSALYFFGRSHEEAPPQPSLRLTVGLAGGPTVAAVGRW
jgi:hypothetical protein